MSGESAMDAEATPRVVAVPVLRLANVTPTVVDRRVDEQTPARVEEAAPIVEQVEPSTVGTSAVDAAEIPEERERTGRLVRPYAMTGGRTAADVATISLEAQIQVSGTQPAGKVYRWEAARILELAATPIALIELSARASIPIGVARVIVSDLAGDGALVVQRPPTQPTYTSLLEKVLAGVRAL